MLGDLIEISMHEVVDNILMEAATLQKPLQHANRWAFTVNQSYMLVNTGRDHVVQAWS